MVALKLQGADVQDQQLPTHIGWLGGELLAQNTWKQAQQQQQCQDKQQQQHQQRSDLMCGRDRVLVSESST